MKWQRRSSLAFAIGKRSALGEELARPSALASAGDAGLGIRLTLGYSLIAALGIGLSIWLGNGSPFALSDPWLALPPLARGSLSVALGVALAFGLSFMTRWSVGRFAWALRLHEELRPFALSLSPVQVLLVAGLSSFGEELLFRGFALPVIGIWGSSAVFGFLHQMRGPSRWVWVAWATAAGLGFALLYRITGSLVAPLVAHALVNAANLGFLRSYPPSVVSEIDQDDEPLPVDETQSSPDP